MYASEYTTYLIYGWFCSEASTVYTSPHPHIPIHSYMISCLLHPEPQCGGEVVCAGAVRMHVASMVFARSLGAGVMYVGSWPTMSPGIIVLPVTLNH